MDYNQTASKAYDGGETASKAYDGGETASKAYWEMVLDIPPQENKMDWIFGNFVNAKVCECTEEFIQSSARVQKRMLLDEAKDDPRYDKWASKLDEYFECALDHWRREQCSDETKMLWDALDVCERDKLSVQNGNLFQKVEGAESSTFYADGKKWSSQFEDPDLVYDHLCKQTGGFQPYHANLNHIEVSNGTMVIGEMGVRFVELQESSRIHIPYPYHVSADTPIFDEWIREPNGPLLRYVIGKTALHPLQRDTAWYTPIFASDSLLEFFKELWGHWFSSFNLSGITTEPSWTRATGGGIMLTQTPLMTTGAVLYLQDVAVPDFGKELPRVIEQCITFYLDNTNKPPQEFVLKKNNLLYCVDVAVEMLVRRWRFDIDKTTVTLDEFNAHVRRFANHLGISLQDSRVPYSMLKIIFRELGFPCVVKKSGISKISLQLDK